MTAPLVLLLSAAHPPDDLRVVRKEGAALAAAGWQVRHLAPGAPSPPIDGVAIETFPRPLGWSARLRAIPALARRAAASGAAVIHASEPDAWAAALLAARRCGARTVLDVHEHYPSRLDPHLPTLVRPPARALLRLLCRAAGRAADAVIVAKDGLDADFPAAIPIRNYALPTPVTPRRHRPGPLTLAHTGALGRSRGWPQLLAALALAPPDTRLRLIGRFTDGSEPAFHAEAAARGLTPRIDQLGWHPHATALALLAEADIALVLFQPGAENHRLALPHKLFDAMLAGLPVIAPAFATEVAAILHDARCGLLVQTADPAAIAAAITTLADPDVRTRLGTAGRHAALTRYAWPTEAARLVALYQRLAPLPPPRGNGQFPPSAL